MKLKMPRYFFTLAMIDSINLIKKPYFNLKSIDLTTRCGNEKKTLPKNEVLHYSFLQ